MLARLKQAVGVPAFNVEVEYFFHGGLWVSPGTGP
jgi:hypothetical protein